MTHPHEFSLANVGKDADYIVQMCACGTTRVLDKNMRSWVPIRDQEPLEPCASAIAIEQEDDEPAMKPIRGFLPAPVTL